MRVVTILAVGILAATTPVAKSCATPPPPGSPERNDTYRTWTADLPAGTPYFQHRGDTSPCAVAQMNVGGAPIYNHVGAWGSIESSQRTNGLPGISSPCRNGNEFWVLWSSLRNVRKG